MKLDKPIRFNRFDLQAPATTGRKSSQTTWICPYILASEARIPRPRYVTYTKKWTRYPVFYPCEQGLLMFMCLWKRHPMGYKIAREAVNQPYFSWLPPSSIPEKYRTYGNVFRLKNKHATATYYDTLELVLTHAMMTSLAMEYGEETVRPFVTGWQIIGDWRFDGKFLLMAFPWDQLAAEASIVTPEKEVKVAKEKPRSAGLPGIFKPKD